MNLADRGECSSNVAVLSTALVEDTGREGSAMATAVRPPRPGRARAALADVTNTSSVKAQKGRSVAKGRSTVREVAVEALKHEHLDANLKKSRGKAPINQVVGTPSSPERSNATAAKDISVVKLVVRGRKAKEQVQLEPKFGDVESKKKGVVQKPRVKVAQAGGRKSTKKIVKETQTSEEEFNDDQHESNACEHEKQEAKASERSVAQKQVASSLAEADSSKLTKRRREPAKAKKSTTAESSQEVLRGGEASPSSVQAISDQNLDTSVSDQVRESESVQKTKVAGKRGPVAISSSKGRRAATGSVRQGRRVPVKPQIQEDMERAVAQNVDDKAARNAHLQTPVAGGGDLRMADGLTDHVVVENLAKGKKGTGKGIAKADDFGSLTLKSVTSASRHESFPEGLVRGTHSVTKVTRGISAELPQTLRRNASRGTRKAVNYAEDINEGKTRNTPKITSAEHHSELPQLVIGSEAQAVTRIVRQTVKKGRKKDAEDVKMPGSNENDDAINSGKEILQDLSVNHAGDDCGSTAEVVNLKGNTQVEDKVSKQSVGDVQTVKRIVRQTVRKGRTKDTKVDDRDKSIGKKNSLHSVKKDLLDRVQAMPSTFESSLEEEYERFKRENRVHKEGAKLPKLTTPEKLDTLSERILIDSAKPLIPIAVCTSLVETVASSKVGKKKGAGGVESISDGLHHNKRTDISVKAISISATLEIAHKSGPSVSLPSSNSSNCSVELVSCSEQAQTIKSNNLLCRTPSQRGQKRSWKENVDDKSTATPVHLSRADCDLTDSEVGSGTLHTSSLKLDIDPIVECDDQDDDHVTDEDSQRSMVGHEDQMYVDVSGRGSDDPLLKAIANFDEADIPTKVKDCCKLLGKPSTIQSHSLPFLLAGRDLVVISDSAPEQILAYGVPVLVHALKKKKSYVRKKPSPIGLVLASSDELVQQITDVLEESFCSLKVKIGNAISASDTSSDMNTVKPGVAILVTTPSCLQKMLDVGRCSLALVSFIVLDGADCMIQNGMEAFLRDVFDQASTCRQTGVFSSTWEPEIEQVVKDLVSETDLVKISIKNPVEVPEQIGEEQDVTQIVEVLEDSDRDTRLMALLRMFQKCKKNQVLVYVLYKEEALHVEGLLQQRGWKVAAVHGGIFEADRNKAVVSFEKGSSSVLVATDVAARGLVIPNVDYVINYSFPYTFEDYACRLRQTGRTGRKGIMHTFFLPANQARAKELVEVLREAEQDVPENLVKLTSPAQKKPRIEY